MKLFFVDLETTGLDPERHGVSQIAGSVCIDGSEVERFDFRVRPLKGQLISNEALAVTGLTMEELRSYPESGTVFRELSTMLGRYIKKYDRTDKFVFVGYNALFDNQFLRKFFENHGDKYFGSWFWYPPVCVMQAAMLQLVGRRRELPNFKLGTVCEHLGITADGDLHDASVDIDLTKKLFYNLVASGVIATDQSGV